MTIFIFRILENYLIKQDSIQRNDGIQKWIFVTFLKKLENAISLMVN
jgi:hypothetical protein